MPPHPVEKRWFRRHPGISLLLFLAFLCTFLAASAEAFLASRRGDEMGSHRYIVLREHLPGADFRAVEDGSLRCRIDADGFIKPSAVHENPELKIFFLGGSTTECMEVPEEKRFPYLAGRILEERTGARINAYNAGHHGNYTLHSINALFNKILPMKPDIVVMMHNFNELVILLHEGSYWHDNPFRSNLGCRPAPSTREAVRTLAYACVPHLFRNTRQAIDRIGVTLGTCDPPNEFAESVLRNQGAPLPPVEAYCGEFGSMLRIFIHMNRSRGIMPVLMTQPHRLADDQNAFGGLIPHDEGVSRFRAFNRSIINLSKETEAELIDLPLANRIPKTPRVLRDVVHYTEAGSELVAVEVAEELMPIVRKRLSSKMDAAGMSE